MRGAKAEAEGWKCETESATRSLRCRSVAVGVRLSVVRGPSPSRSFILLVYFLILYTRVIVCAGRGARGGRVPMRDECMYSMTPMRNGIPPSPTVSVISMRDTPSM